MSNFLEKGRIAFLKAVFKTYSKYLIERSVEDYELSMQTPSTIALAAISNSLKKISMVPSLCDEKDCSKLIDAIERCMHFSIHGSDVDNVAKKMFDFGVKTIK